MPAATRHRSSAFVPLTILVLATVLPGAGLAQSRSDEKLRRLETMGRTAYSEERFRDAIDAFDAAYRTQPQPRYLYNIGRCHEKLAQYGQAISYIERYLKGAKTAKDKADAEALLAYLRVKHERTQAAAEDEPPLPQDYPDLPDDLPDVAAQPATYVSYAPAEDPVANAPQTSVPSEGSRWLSYAALGGGALLMGTGAALGLMSVMAEEARDDLQGVEAVPVSKFREEDDAAHSYALGANVLFVAGGLAAASGLVLLLLEDDGAEPGRAEIRVVPGGVGVSVFLEVTP